MKGTRALIVLFLALACGLAAMILGAQWMTSRAVEPGGKLLIAARDIGLGSPIDADDDRGGDLVGRDAADRRIQRPRGARRAGGQERTPARRADPREPAGAASVPRGGLSAVIADGKRAITVKVNEVVGVAGFALPGNFVDVMVNVQDAAATRCPRSSSSGSWCWRWLRKRARTRPSRRVVSAVTLEVSPAEAESSIWRAASARSRWCCATRSISRPAVLPV